MKKIKHISYDSNEYSKDGPYHEHYWKQCALKLLVDHVADAQDCTLLDYGCGRGEFLRMTQQAGFVASGVDVDEECVKISSRYGKAEVIKANNYLEDCPGNSYDIISSFHVLEHVENPKRLLLNMQRVAKQYVLIAVPNMRAFMPLRGMKFSSVNEGHLQGWDKPTLYNLAVNHCGLSLVKFCSDMTAMPSLGYRMRKLFGASFETTFNIKVLSKIWPNNSISIIGLFRV